MKKQRSSCLLALPLVLVFVFAFPNFALAQEGPLFPPQKSKNICAALLSNTKIGVRYLTHRTAGFFQKIIATRGGALLTRTETQQEITEREASKGGGFFRRLQDTPAALENKASKLHQLKACWTSFATWCADSMLEEQGYVLSPLFGLRQMINLPVRWAAEFLFNKPHQTPTFILALVLTMSATAPLHQKEEQFENELDEKIALNDQATLKEIRDSFFLRHVKESPQNMQTKIIMARKIIESWNNLWERIDHSQNIDTLYSEGIQLVEGPVPDEMHLSLREYFLNGVPLSQDEQIKYFLKSEEKRQLLELLYVTYFDARLVTNFFQDRKQQQEPKELSDPSNPNAQFIKERTRVLSEDPFFKKVLERINNQQISQVHGLKLIHYDLWHQYIIKLNLLLDRFAHRPPADIFKDASGKLISPKEVLENLRAILLTLSEN